MILTWQSIYSVNVRELDDQHKKLFDILNRVFEIKNVEDGGGLESILEELEEYANYHFSMEEKYFDKFNYPEKDQHKKMHEFYVEKIREIKKAGLNEEAIIELRIFLKDWWLRHIQNVDQRYSDFFNQNHLF